MGQLPRILTYALAVLILTVAALLGGMAKREYASHAGCTTYEKIKVWQVVNVTQKRTCSLVGEPPTPPLKNKGQHHHHHARKARQANRERMRRSRQ